MVSEAFKNVPQLTVTTFAFSSVFILLLWSAWSTVDIHSYRCAASHILLLLVNIVVSLINSRTFYLSPMLMAFRNFRFLLIFSYVVNQLCKLLVIAASIHIRQLSGTSDFPK